MWEAEVWRPGVFIDAFSLERTVDLTGRHGRRFRFDVLRALASRSTFCVRFYLQVQTQVAASPGQPPFGLVWSALTLRDIQARTVDEACRLALDEIAKFIRNLEK